MLKNILSFLNPSKKVFVNDIVSQALKTTTHFNSHLVGHVTIIVDEQVNEPSILMNICPELLELLEINDDGIKFKNSAKLQDNHNSIFMDNKDKLRLKPTKNKNTHSVIINELEYPVPNFLIRVNNINQIQLDGPANYTFNCFCPNSAISLNVEGSGEYNLNIKAKKTDAFLHTSSQVKGSINCSHLHVEYDGVGNVQLDGSSEYGSLIIDGIGLFDSQNLNIEKGNLQLESDGDIIVSMANIQDGFINTIGNVTVHTSTPQKIKQEGTGKISTQTMSITNPTLSF